MLDIRSISELASRCHTTSHELTYLSSHVDRFVRHLELYDPSKPEKPPRPVISTFGPLRRIQNCLLREVLLPRIRPSVFNHGGVSGRDIKSNALAHADSVYGWKTDLSRFFPSIHQWRVYRLFSETLGCEERVAGILTRLCTYDYHLPLGLPTSPLLADQIAKGLDRRIAGLAMQHGLVYTRFVDDLTLSGAFSFDLKYCRLPRLIERIISECGFSMAAQKTCEGRLRDANFVITKLRLHIGRLDVAADYVLEVERQIADHHDLACDKHFVGPLLTRDMLRSRIAFVISIRPSRRLGLLRRFGSINWAKVADHAKEKGLLLVRKKLRPVGVC